MRKITVNPVQTEQRATGTTIEDQVWKMEGGS